MYCSCLAQSRTSKILSSSNRLGGIFLIKESHMLKTCIFIVCSYLTITGSLYLVKFTSDRYLNSSFSFSPAKLCLLKMRIHVGTVPFWLMQTNGRLYSFRFLICYPRLKFHSHKKTKFFKAIPEFDIFFFVFTVVRYSSGNNNELWGCPLQESWYKSSSF